MGIRIGITDGNRQFFERFREALQMEYPDEFEVYLFPNLAKAIHAVEKFRIRVVLIEPCPFDPDPLQGSKLPATACYVRLCERKQEEKEWEHRDPESDNAPLDAIPLLCRYRSVEEWRALLLQFVSSLSDSDDKAETKPREGSPGGGASEGKKDCHIVLFTSAAGGTGVSTAARGFAECCRRHSRNTLYLDLQTFPEQLVRPGDDLYTLEDILLSIRGRRYAPDAVLDRAIRTEAAEVMTIYPPANPAALFDMTGEEIITIVDLIKETKRFSMIILDLDFDATERAVLPYLTADRVVLVSNGSQIANRKTQMLMNALPSLCTEDPMALYRKTCLLYNRFQQGIGEVLDSEAFLKLGGVGELPLQDPEDLAGELSVSPAMERLYEILNR